MDNKQKSLAGLLIGLAGTAFLFGLTYSVHSAKKLKNIFKLNSKDEALAFRIAELICAINKSEIKDRNEAVRFAAKFFSRNFSTQTSQNALKVIHNQAEINLIDVCQYVKDKVAYPVKLQILFFLFTYASSGKALSAKELKLLEFISGNISVRMRDFKAISNMFSVPQKQTAYSVLCISETATNDEIKANYRRLAKQYHPDKNTHLSGKEELAISEKFKQINEAYDYLKKIRGF